MSFDYERIGMRFRDDVNGLRGLAVLVVVAFQFNATAGRFCWVRRVLCHFWLPDDRGDISQGSIGHFFAAWYLYQPGQAADS